MIVEVSKTRGGAPLTVERIGPAVLMKVGRSPNIQSILPVPPGMYYDSVKLAAQRNTLLIVGVAGGSAAHVGKAAGFKRIYGLDADGEMVRLGGAHFKLMEVMDGVALGDAYDFESWRRVGWADRWDCILFDAYNASTLSERALDAVYLRFLTSRLSPGGVLLFNCPTRGTMEALRYALPRAGLTAAWHKYGSNMVALIRKP